MGIRVRRALAHFVGGAAAVSLLLAMTPATPAQASGTSGSGAAIFTAIDGYLNDPDPTSCSGGTQPGAVAFRDMILRAVGGGDSGIYNCQAGASDHNEGRAWDWKMNVGNASEVTKVNTVLHWLLDTDERGNRHAMARRLGIKYIIWNRRIWEADSPNSWQPFYGDNEHTDHVHFSFNPPGARKQTSWWTSNNRTPRWALSNSMSSNTSTIPGFGYGYGSTIAVTGDWDGNGTDTPGLFNQVNQSFLLRNSNTSGVADGTIFYGSLGDKPIVGNWDGHGGDDVGIYRPTEARFYLRGGDGSTRAVIPFGNVGDQPITGDWDGDGRDDIGVYRPSEGRFYYRYASGVTESIWFGNPGEIPLIGDWNSDGTDDVGIYRASTRTFWYRYVVDEGGPNEREIVRSTSYGDLGWTPVIGNWDGIGGDGLGAIFL